MKKYKKIVLAGGNGYMGQVFAAFYADIAEDVIVLSRTPKTTADNIRTLVWDGKTEGKWVDEIDGADLLINLCGKNVNCRYTEKNKAGIINSRVVPTKLLGDAIAKLANPPQLWINITSATIYRHAEDHAQDETTGEIGHGFSIEVCKQWEESFFATHTPQTRKVALRMGIVLGRADGVFPRLLNLVKMGIGGKQGNGQQYVAWVHEQDAARCTEFLLTHPAIEGLVNCTAPNAIKNTDMMKALRAAYGIPFGLPAPAWLLEIGALVIGTETELILKSRWVKPQRLLDAGYNFQFEKAEHAINEILSIKN